MITSPVHDPHLPPDWRWQHALSLRDHDSPDEDDDDYARAALDFQVREKNCKSADDRRNLFERYPAIYSAQELYRRADGMRWSVEAFLLARADFAEIAEFYNTQAEVISWFERLFFNVVPFLDSPAYIVNVVLGEKVHFGMAESDYGLLWKVIGYAGGPDLLRSFINPCQLKRAAAADQANAAYAAAHDCQLRRKALVAALTMPVSGNYKVIFSAYHKAQELQQARGAANHADNSIKQNINAALEAFKECVRVGTNPSNAPLLAKFQKGCVEAPVSQV